MTEKEIETVKALADEPLSELYHRVKDTRKALLAIGRSPWYEGLTRGELMEAYIRNQMELENHAITGPDDNQGTSRPSDCST